MKLEDAIKRCHVRSAVYQTSNPNKKYWKNHTIRQVNQIPKELHNKTDWEEYDPREDDDCSLFMFND